MMPRITFSSLTREVLSLYAPPMRRIATRRKMQQILEEFAPLCRYVGDLTPAAVAAWVAAHADRRPASLDSHLRSLRAACNYAVGRGYLRSSPFAFRSPRAWVDWDVPELPPPVHSAEEIARVLALADREASGGDWRAARLRAVVYTAAYTGARRCEILAALAADLQLDYGVIRIATNGRRRLKTPSSAAQIPVAAPLAAVLEAWLPLCGSEWLFPGVRRRTPWLEGPVGGKALDELKALGLRVGVPGLTFLSLRHSYASLSEGWGIGPGMLQRLLRHSSPDTQQYYRHPLAAPLREAAAKVHFP